MKAQLISISEAARLIGKTRGTVAKAAQGLIAKPGPKGSQLYSASSLMMSIYGGNERAQLFEGNLLAWERMQRR